MEEGWKFLNVICNQAIKNNQAPRALKWKHPVMRFSRWGIGARSRFPKMPTVTNNITVRTQTRNHFTLKQHKSWERSLNHSFFIHVRAHSAHGTFTSYTCPTDIIRHTPMWNTHVSQTRHTRHTRHTHTADSRHPRDISTSYTSHTRNTEVIHTAYSCHTHGILTSYTHSALKSHTSYLHHTEYSRHTHVA